MENLKLIINIVVALSTVITLIFIWLTLREMKVSRYKLFEPQIFFINSNIYLLCNYPEIILPIKYSTKKETLELSENSEFYLKFKNIGQGIAKDIFLILDWNINYKEYFELLKFDFDKYGIGLKITISDGSCWIDATPENKINFGGNFPFENKTDLKFDYLLPVHNSNESLKINVPSSIELFFALSTLLFEVVPDNKKKEVFDRMDNYFKVGIKIKYKDNLNKPFEKEFELDLKTPKIEMSSEYQGKIYTIGIER